MLQPTAVVVTDIAFWEPGIGSHGRIEQVCRLLATRFEVTVFVFKSIGAQRQAAIDAAGYPFDIVSYKDYERAALADPQPLRGNPEPVLSRWYHPSWQAAFQRFVDEQGPALVMLEYIRLADLLDALPPGTVRVIDTHDVMSMRSISFFAFGEVPSIVLPLAKEVELLRRFDFALAISGSDQAWMQRQLPPGMAMLLPYAPGETYESEHGQGPTQRLVFAGAGSPANTRSLSWFADQVMPFLTSGQRLEIYGPISNMPLRCDPVVRHGIVASTAEIYQEFGVVINPVFFGGGIKIKTLEGLIAGLPVVSSVEGARGLEQFVGLGLWVARDHGEFVAGVEQACASTVSRAGWLEQRAGLLRLYAEQARGAGLVQVMHALVGYHAGVQRAAALRALT